MTGSAARLAPNAPPSRRMSNAHRAFAVSAGVCLLIFGWMVTLGTFRFVALDAFGSFYDHQAAAWLKGSWDVPEPSLSSEAFIVDGKVYGYFGPTPALMRLPFLLAGVGFATVTRILMLIDYAACLAAAHALLVLATRWRTPAASPSSCAVVLNTLTAGLGSMLFFLGSRAYVYHEAILCGAAFGLWSVFFSLRFLHSPKRARWIGGLLCGVLAVQARAPIGLFALVMLGCAALVVAARSLRSADAGAALRPALVLGASVLGVVSFNAVSYLKFGTFEGCPLRFNAQYTPEDLAQVEHRNFHFSNLRFNSDSYLFRPTLTLTGNFPFLYRAFVDRKAYPESRIVYRDPTLAMPWSMPGLFSHATAGTAIAAVVVPAFRLPLITLWTAAIPATIAMLTAISVTQRYTADFCPLLIAAGAFAVAAVGDIPAAFRRLVVMASALLCAVGIAVVFVLTIHHQREIVWGVPEEARQSYREFSSRVDAFFGSRTGGVDYPRNGRGS